MWQRSELALTNCDPESCFYEAGPISGTNQLISPCSSSMNHTCQQQLGQGGFKWELHHVSASGRQRPSIVQRTQHLQDSNMQAASGKHCCWRTLSALHLAHFASSRRRISMWL